MTLGQLARGMLGPLFPAVGRAYRSLFVSLDAVAETFPDLSPAAHVLDIGRGRLLLLACCAVIPGARHHARSCATSAPLSSSSAGRGMPASVAAYREAGCRPETSSW
jgi:hypothetical protein